MSLALGRAFSSLHVPNYRRYFAGQVISISGNWMQTVAEMWLVVQLTGSGVSVGLTAGLQFLPVLLLGAYGGVLADRLDKRRLLMVTQACMIVPGPGAVGAVAAGAVEIWMVYALVLVRGTVTAIDNPARQAFVTELVGPDRVVNAVSLNSVIVHTARIVGPALAGADHRGRRRRTVLRGQRPVLRGDVLRAAGDGPARSCSARSAPARGRGQIRRGRAGAAPRRSCARRWR